ncbi:MAG TPA: phosphodiester glycosidase family protein [Candidatus Baltobacteraceae bacterium]|nr:phosphodiester glycosidase family protein [Candidatus Baltobacteraceae bacterium]
MAVTLLLAALLPLAPLPAAPFPHVVTDAVTIENVAPGVEYGEYRMRTSDGPLSIHVLAVDPHEPTVHIQAALANDRLVSPGETLSSMAQRTQAVAGINADYFDINQTNQPLNLLVENTRFIRSPMQRPVFAIGRDGHAYISEFSVAETAHFADRSLPLAAMNDWPVHGSAALLVTPDFGTLRAAPGVTLVPLDAGATPPLTSYRTRDAIDALQPRPPGYYLAFGPQVDANAIPPSGTAFTIDAAANPALDDVVNAAGGGPLLVKDGRWYADPHGPSSGEFATHMPATAGAIRADGTILFFEIDGRQPAISVGVLQPQIAALTIAFGAQTAMQFDGGGSSTMVARLAGDQTPEVVNSPSDGTERRIADALLIASDAPPGAPVRIVTRPQIVRAAAGAHVDVLAAEVDAGGRTVSSFHVPIVADATTKAIEVERDGLRASIPVNVQTPARLEIDPLDPVVPLHGSVQLSVRAFDAQGYPVALPSAVSWTTGSGTIDKNGLLRGVTQDARVTAHAGGATAGISVVVGEHAQPIAFAQQATFATAPANGAGGLRPAAGCSPCVALSYDFSGTERAAYANVSMPLQERALGLSADVDGDGNGETLRVAVENAIHERFLYTIARIDWHGVRHVEVRFPQGLPQPIVLRSIYVVAKVGAAAAAPKPGAVVLSNLREILAGSAANAPK